MDYENKYNEAIEKARAINSGEYVDIPAGDTVLEYVFPELKESEGEKVKKRILLSLQKDLMATKNSGCDTKDLENCIAWLERQNEKSVKSNPYSGVSFKYKNHTFGMCAREGGVEISIDGELKAFISSEKSFIYPIHPVPELTPKSAFEAAKEEKVDNQNCVKPDDKVKPRFKVGDWVVFNNKHQSIYQVERIEDGYYILRHTHGGTFRVRVLHDESLRLWTIEDARDGDVLVVPKIDGSEHSELIFIFKEIKDREYVKNAVEYYCRFIDNEFYVNVKGFMGQSDDYFVPATKEQRDTLMKAMADAGYTFDFEKKELKEWAINDAKSGDVIVDGAGLICIYQEPSTKTFFHSFCYCGEDTFCRLGGSHKINGCRLATKQECYKLFSEMYKAGYEWDKENLKLKPLWNDIDEEYFNELFEHFHINNKLVHKPYEINIWLRSIKQRIKRH